MTVAWSTIGDCRIVQGDCVEAMRELPDASVHCCVTSPPYYGLRDYGVDGQIGLEATPDEYASRMVAAFREVRRVLRADGTLWLNLGDGYNSAASGQNGTTGTLGGGIPCGGSGTTSGRRPLLSSLKRKDLLGIPWRVAFGLQADGWYLRQDIIWHKPNPMPESVTDRCTKAHEYMFLLSKSERYWFDSEAMQEDAVCGARGSVFHTGKTADHQLGRASKKPRESKARGKFNGKTNELPGREAFRAIKDTRNRRSVWTVATRPYKGAHFATFPPSLVEPCILAGCPLGGTVLDPFGGSGTTAAVALKHGRRAILCELNPQYVALIRERLDAVVPEMFRTETAIDEAEGRQHTGA